MKKYNINQTTLRILGLYRADYRGSHHLREIARHTSVDVKAVQLQLKRLEGAGILTCATTKARIKEYSLNLGEPLVIYYMALAETFAATECLARNLMVKRAASEMNGVEGIVLLFGSYVKGEGGEGDPIDLLAISQAEPNGDLFADVGKRIGREVRVRTVNKSWFQQGLGIGDPLIMEAVENHVVLKGIDEFCRLIWTKNAVR